MIKKEQKHPITLTQTGYGHYRITLHNYRGKDITAIITCMPHIDAYNDYDNERRHNSGYNSLRSFVISKNRSL